MAGRPVTIRLLDPPLHEFLPQAGPQTEALAKKLGVSYERIEALGHSLHEFNPMLGHRGCRLGIVYPEITEMQSRAIVRAALAVAKKTGKKVLPEVMIPLVGYVAELKLQLEIVNRVFAEEFAKAKTKLPYLVGTMIEIPRAAITAHEIAAEAEFFSFGTNDLTQTTLGMSRDDSGKFLPPYQKLGIVKANPFATIDQSGVGELMKIAVKGGEAVRPGIKLGICGEHGGDPDHHRVLPSDRPDLRQLLALPRAGGASGRRPGGAQAPRAAAPARAGQGRQRPRQPSRPNQPRPAAR
jgi:pyruvate,orthophosphate dikinase